MVSEVRILVTLRAKDADGKRTGRNLLGAEKLCILIFVVVTQVVYTHTNPSSYMLNISCTSCTLLCAFYT